MHKNIKNSTFLFALIGAVVIFLNALGDLLGFSIDNEVITAVITGFAGVLVVLGVVTMSEQDAKGNKKENQEDKEIENKDTDLSDKNDDELE